MLGKAARRVGIVLVVVSFLSAFTLAGTRYFLPALLLTIVLQLLVQSSTEIGWRVFRADLDERQEALKSRILDISYRVLIGLSVAGMLGAAVLGPHFRSIVATNFFGPFLSMPRPSISGRPIVSMFPDPRVLAVEFGLLLLIALFFLPGLVAAWIEPARSREPAHTSLE